MVRLIERINENGFITGRWGDYWIDGDLIEFWSIFLGACFDRGGHSSNNERMAEIILMRWTADGARRMTLKDIGNYFNITGNRIRQIESAAIRRARYYLKYNDQNGPSTFYQRPE